MAHWLRFQHDNTTGFGMLEGDVITVHGGDMFNAPAPTGQSLALDSVRILTPTHPSKMICLWNNFHAAAGKLNLAIPAEPLYFIKAPSSYLAHGETIRKPASYEGRVVFEGELGVVVGKTLTHATPAQAAAAIFGYTCINDVTAIDLLSRDPAFPQWTRAKSFDTFGVFGPVIATGLGPRNLSVRTLLNGRERQNYACADMIFAPDQLLSRISCDMTLAPGDIIACGTSLGAGPMRPGSDIEVVIEGVGSLHNRFE